MCGTHRMRQKPDIQEITEILNAKGKKVVGHSVTPCLMVT